MPKFHPEAPDLVVGPDGKWAAELIPGELRVYDLSATPSENQPNRLSPLETMRQEERSGRIFFVQSDRLMQLSIDDGPDHSSSVVAELWQLPQLTKIGRSVRVPGAVRILGGGAGGVVVAPSGTGAELVMPRESDLVVYKLFVRGEALSAGATPDRRILIEQRGIFEIWDAQTRRAMAKLMLNTRQAPLQLGFIGDGKLVWALTSAIPMRASIPHIGFPSVTLAPHVTSPSRFVRRRTILHAVSWLTGRTAARLSHGGGYSMALVSIIGLSDITWLADQAGRTTHEPFLFYAVVCVFYLALTALSGLVFNWLERRYSVGVRRASA